VTPHRHHKPKHGNRATVEEAQQKNLDGPGLHVLLYQIAFSQDDTPGMAQQASWAASTRGMEDLLLASEADTAAYFGQLGKARELAQRAVGFAERAGAKEMVAGLDVDAALHESLFGNAAEVRRQTATALRLSMSRDVREGAALALALAGDPARAQALADGLIKSFPEDTFVRFIYLPMIRAQLALGHYDSSTAIEGLRAAALYELSDLYIVYIRGTAFLAAKQGSEAAVEFQKILDHRGVVVNEPIGALAHLGLARAYAMQSDSAKARAAYQDFLTLWKDADPDVSILKQAKAEYAKLQ